MTRYMHLCMNCIHLMRVSSPHPYLFHHRISYELYTVKMCIQLDERINVSDNRRQRKTAKLDNQGLS
jgi:hypothetical protein